MGVLLGVRLSAAADCEYTFDQQTRVVVSLENTFVQLETEMSVKQVSLSICGFALFSTFVNAHSGHGDPSDSSGIVHYLTSPIHVLPVLFAAVLATAIVVSAIRNRRLSAVKVRR